MKSNSTCKTGRLFSNSFTQHEELRITMTRIFWLVIVATTANISAEAQDFTVIALPDTQNYSSDYPDLYHAQTQWCVDNLAVYNIQFVTHLGDVVNDAATLYQWDNARAAMNRLDNGNVPYGIAPGNHDFLYPGDYYDPAGTNYLDYFGPSYYMNESWYMGASPSGLSNYQIINYSGVDWLFLHLCLETPAEELAWAQTVINAHPQSPVLVSTHRYMSNWYLWQGRYQDWQYAFESLYRHDGIRAGEFFNGFVAPNRQIYMVACGHSDGEVRQVSQNNAGLPVHELLQDFQTTYGNGGNGWLRIFEYRPDANEIFVRTHSPSLNDWRTGDQSQFTLHVDFEQYVLTSPSLRFQNGSGEYSSTVDTWINEDSGGSSYGSSSILVVDDDTANSWFEEYEGQAMIRWENIIGPIVYEGDPTPNYIPSNATLHSASITLNLADDTDLGNPEFYVYRMTANWDEGSTWNSMSGGIDVGSETDPTRLATFLGDNNPDGNAWRTFDVTPAVQAWLGGSPNYGICILPQRIDFNDDGIEIHSSENGNVATRPALDVAFDYAVLNTPPTITTPLWPSTLTAYEGEDVELSVDVSEPNPTDPIILYINEFPVGYGTGSGVVNHFVLMEDEGEYTFIAEVADDEASVPAGEITVTALNANPVITEINEDLTVAIDEPFEFHVIAGDPGIYDTITIRWDLDLDGEYDDFTGSAGTWSYGEAGVRLARAQVTDNDGGETLGQFSVNVQYIFTFGDFDRDEDVDLDDYAGLYTCRSGPDVMPQPTPPTTAMTCLQAFDFDSDSDVDLADVSEFQLQINLP